MSCPNCGSEAVVGNHCASCSKYIGAVLATQRKRTKPCRRHKWGAARLVNMGGERREISRCVREGCREERHVEVGA